MADQTELKGIWGYSDAELRSNLSPETGTKLYHLRVGEGEVGAWDDGRPRLDLPTEVVCGEHGGKNGPRITLSIGESTLPNGSVITEKAAWERVVRFVRLVHPEPVSGFDEPIVMGEGLADLIPVVKGEEFVAAIGRDGEYDRVKRTYAKSKAPKEFRCECALEGFRLE